VVDVEDLKSQAAVDAIKSLILRFRFIAEVLPLVVFRDHRSNILWLLTTSQDYPSDPFTSLHWYSLNLQSFPVLVPSMLLGHANFLSCSLSLVQQQVPKQLATLSKDKLASRQTS